jgi:hypothetical protein
MELPNGFIGWRLMQVSPLRGFAFYLLYPGLPVWANARYALLRLTALVTAALNWLLYFELITYSELITHSQMITL